MTKPIRVLQLVSSANPSSGVRNVVTNWYRNIDVSKVQFDYLYVNIDGIVDQEDITRLGANFYVLPSPSKYLFQFLHETYLFFKIHRYKTIHSHFTHLNIVFYPLAKWFGTKNIIQHAHGTKWSDKKLNGLRNYLMLHAVWPLITHKLACSQAAGKCWYGNNFTVINNGVDVEKFAYNPAVRAQKRKELGLENNFVVAHVGRFSAEKNHTFLIDIFREVVALDPSARLVLVGGGPLANSIKKKVLSLNLQDKVLFLGVRKDVPDLLQAFDVCVLPSFHEGMPVVGVEAQATGLPCVFADTITPEVLLLPSSTMLSLKDSPTKWAQRILALKNQPRTSGKEALQAKSFDIKQIAKQVQSFYERLNK